MVAAFRPGIFVLIQKSPEGVGHAQRDGSGHLSFFQRIEMLRSLYSPLLVMLSLLAACTSSKQVVPTDTLTVPPSPALTADPCSGASLSAQVKKVNDLTRQFDDYSVLAFNTPQSQIVQVIPAMQTIRRDAQDLTPPACLHALKNLQLSYMNTTIETLLVFQSNPKSTLIGIGIAQSRLEHDQYTIELASLLGVTLVPHSTSTSGIQPAGSTTPAAAASNSGFAILIVTNPGPNPINLRGTSSLAAPVLGTLNVGQSTTAVAQSGDGKWYQVYVPGQPGKIAWLLAALVQVNGTLIPTP